MLDTTDETQLGAAETARVAKGSDTPTRRGFINREAGTLEMTGGDTDPATYGAAELPEAVRDYLVLHGLRGVLRAAKDEAGAYAGLCAGKLPGHREAEQGKQPSAWKQAIARAMVARTKKTERPLTFEETSKRVETLDRATQIALRNDLDVRKEYHKITGKTSALDALLNSLDA